FNRCDGGQGKVGPRPEIGIAGQVLGASLAFLARLKASRHCPPPEGVISETLFIKEQALGAYLDTDATQGRPYKERLSYAPFRNRHGTTLRSSKALHPL